MTTVLPDEQAAIKTYSGWTNRETWVANLWLTNDEGSYELLQDICRTDGDTWEKAETLEAFYQDSLDDTHEVPSIWRDLLTASLSRVDWYRIIEANQEDAR